MAAVLYLAFAVYSMWPLPRHFDSQFFGSGDPQGQIAYYNGLVEAGQVPFTPGRIADFAAPDGQSVEWVLAIAAAPSVLVFWLGAALFNAVAAVNLYVLVGFVLTGMAVFLLARRLTGNASGALIAGWAAAFYPFSEVNSRGHYDYMHGWVLVLAVWRMLELARTPNRRNALLAGVSVVFAMWWTPYFILLGAVAYATLAAAALFRAVRGHQLRRHLWAQALTAGIVLLFLAGLLGLTVASSSQAGLRQNTIENLNVYSARPWEYVVPPADHPLWGSYTGPWLARHIHGSNAAESTLYVGVSLLLVALFVLVRLLRGRLAPRLRWGAGALLAMTAVAVLFSAPPKGVFGGITITFPSQLVFDVTSTWRVYSRFVIVVMLGLALLLAIGVTALQAGRRPMTRGVITLGVGTIVLFDLWTANPLRCCPSSSTQPPPVYKALRDEPPGRVAEYPIVPADEGNFNDVFWQEAHDKPIINGYHSGSIEEKRALGLMRLRDSATAQGLGALGVRYIVVRAENPGYGLPPPGTPPRQFTVLAKDPTRTVYRVPSSAAPVLATPLDGFGDREVDGGRSFTWLLAARGRYELLGDCRPCRGTISFSVASFARPRWVTVVDSGGRSLASRHVVRSAEMRFHVIFTGRTTLWVAANPGPQSIHATTGGPDPRSVSVSVGQPHFVLD